MVNASQAAVIAVVSLLVGVGVTSHWWHHKPVTVTVTRPLEFEPFANWGTTPDQYVPVPKDYNPPRFGLITQRDRYWERCFVRLKRLHSDKATKSGLKETCGVIAMWI